MSRNGKIFVSIAALEEPSLVDTIKNCLKNAKNPNNIIFGISLQYSNEPDLSFIDNQSRIIKYPLPDYNNNIGPGIIEIRNAIKKLHKDEEYFLQIDSHTVFDKNWDNTLIVDLDKFENKTIISKQLWQQERMDSYVTKYSIDMSRPQGLLIGYTSEQDEDVSNIIKEKRIKNLYYFKNTYLSGNFIFTKSKWLYEVPISNHKYVYEEVEPAIISYCYGYDIVSPLRSNQVIFSGIDYKYSEPLDEKWWDIVKVDPNDKTTWLYGRKWIRDNNDMVKEVEKLMLFGKNKYISLEHTARPIEDFYKEVGISKEYMEELAKIESANNFEDFDVVGHYNKEALFFYRETIADKQYRGGK